MCESPLCNLRPGRIMGIFGVNSICIYGKILTLGHTVALILQNFNLGTHSGSKLARKMMNHSKLTDCYSSFTQPVILRDADACST